MADSIKIEDVEERVIPVSYTHLDGLKLAIDEMVKKLEETDCDIIAGAESRGFVFGMPIAYLMHKPFVMIRKAGKLPCEPVSKTYDLEYGTATIEIHKDAIKPGPVSYTHLDVYKRQVVCKRRQSKL